MRLLKQEKLNWAYTVLGILLLAGVIFHGAAYLAADMLFPPEGLSITANPDGVYDRIRLLQWAYHVCSICVFCFFVGNLFLLWNSRRQETTAGSGNRAVYYLKLSAAVLICTGIFAVIDIDDWQDYFFPLWTVFIEMAVLLALSTGVWLSKRRKAAQPL